MKLKTIGYEGSSPDSFLKALRDAHVEHVVDVRALALSRKQGFSKTALRAMLELESIAYSHVRALGNSREGRVAARTGEYQRFRTAYTSYLHTSDAQDALRLVARYARESLICLLCFERNAALCHRSLVAKSLEAHYHLEVEHLVATIRTDWEAHDRYRGGGRSREGRASPKP